MFTLDERLTVLPHAMIAAEFLCSPKSAVGISNFLSCPLQACMFSSLVEDAGTPLDLI